MIKYILNKRIDQNMKLLGKINYFKLLIASFLATFLITSCNDLNDTMTEEEFLDEIDVFVSGNVDSEGIWICIYDNQGWRN